MHTQFKTENLNAAEGMLDRCQFFFNKKNTPSPKRLFLWQCTVSLKVTAF